METLASLSERTTLSALDRAAWSVSPLDQDVVFDVQLRCGVD
jgi:hypothetical protein